MREIENGHVSGRSSRHSKNISSPIFLVLAISFWPLAQHLECLGHCKALMATRSSFSRAGSMSDSLCVVPLGTTSLPQFLGDINAKSTVTKIKNAKRH